MPKEYIKYANVYVIRDDPKGSDIPAVLMHELAKDGEQQRYTETVAAHWSKGDGGVAQLSVSLDAEMVREVLDWYDKGHQSNVEEPGRITFYTTDFDRQELQRLVRLGRKMRDDVHGADE